VLICLAACHKTEFNSEGSETAKVSFYNASNKIDSVLTAAKTTVKIVLPLSLQSGQHSAPLVGNLLPFFQGGSGVIHEFPGTSNLNAVPWMVFEDYSAGVYQSDLHADGLASPILFSFNMQVMKNNHNTYFLSDSAGNYKTTAVTHLDRAQAGKIRFRFIQLSPDADSLNLHINTVLQAGKFQNMSYRKISDYIEYDMPKDSLLRLRLFNGSDSLNITARRDLTVQPGSSYFLIYKGYSKDHDAGKFGRDEAIIRNAALDVRKIE